VIKVRRKLLNEELDDPHASPKVLGWLNEGERSWWDIWYA